MPLNVSGIKKAIDRAGRSVKGDLSRRKLLSAVAGRSELVNVGKAKKIARQKQSRLVESGRFESIGDMERGASLKDGILGMANRAILPDEIYDKLEKMEPDKLDALYQQNDLIFEVYFDYSGAETTDNGAVIMDTAQKKRDALFLIDLYQKTYGVTL